jgi:FkbM family methyltransferase
MLIKLDFLFSKYNLNIYGILHIGAHLCEEREDYIRHGLTDENIIWVEGNYNLITQIKQNYPNSIIWNNIISDRDDEFITLHLANNGQSSSILELGTHKKHYNHIKYVKDIDDMTKTIKTLYKEHGISSNFANFLNIDIQGAELLALKGMKDLLHNFDYLYLEVNQEELYKNCHLINEIDDYVKQFNFQRVETKMTREKWGDAFYIKNLIN